VVCASSCGFAIFDYIRQIPVTGYGDMIFTLDSSSHRGVRGGSNRDAVVRGANIKVRLLTCTQRNEVSYSHLDAFDALDR
jgi:hypothetical protein